MVAASYDTFYMLREQSDKWKSTYIPMSDHIQLRKRDKTTLSVLCLLISNNTNPDVVRKFRNDWLELSPGVKK
jgi:hypothetical protein